MTGNGKKKKGNMYTNKESFNSSNLKLWKRGGGGKEKKLVGKWWLIFKPQKRPTFGPQKLEVVGGNQFKKYIDPPFQKSK